MKAEKLHDVAYEIRQEYSKREIPKKVSQISTHLNHLRQPAQTDQDPESLVSGLDSLRDSLEKELEQAPSNEFVPSQVRLLKDIGGWMLTGARLQETVDNIFEAGPDPEHAFQKFRALEHLVSSFNQNLETLIDVFSDLDVDREHLPADEAEVGVLYPLESDEATVDDLKQEINRLDKFLPVFSEVVGETGVSYRIRAVSSSGIAVYLGVHLAAAWLVSKVIKKITGIINDVQDIRLKQRKLKQMDYIEEIDEDKIEEYIKQRVEEVTAEVMESYKGGDDGRKEEVENHVRKTLEYMLELVDRDGIFEVKVFAPPEDREDDVDVEGFTSFADFKESGTAMRELGKEGDRVLFMQPPEQLEAPGEEGDEAEIEEDEGGDADGADE